MDLPRTSTMNQFLRAARLSTATASKTSSKVSPPTMVQGAMIERKIYPYRITRTPSNNYPIYTLAKRGGNMKLTKLRRIEGDVSVLRKDLQLALGMDEKEVVINQLTRHIIVKVFVSIYDYFILANERLGSQDKGDRTVFEGPSFVNYGREKGVRFVVINIIWHGRLPLKSMLFPCRSSNCALP